MFCYFRYPMIKADLHTHSEYSNDGELSVKGIVQKCIDNQIGTLSITDHNGVGATEEAVGLCSQSNINFIPGIEIDCNYQGIDLHLLGYQIDWRSKEFTDLEKIIDKKIMDALPQMVENLAKEGIEVDVDEVLRKSKGKPPSAELLAEVLFGNKESFSNSKLKPYMEGGSRSDMPYINFYLDFFAQGKPAYVKIDHMSYSDAIELVRSHGGIPIVAHPGLNLKGREAMAIELLDQGAAGLEVFNNYHDGNQIDYFASLVQQKEMLMTCGSDFHGKNKPLIDIGKYASSDKYHSLLSRSIDFILQHALRN